MRGLHEDGGARVRRRVTLGPAILHGFALAVILMVANGRLTVAANGEDDD